MTPADLAARWRADADILDGYNDTRGATLLRRCADDLDAALRDAMAEVLDLTTAAHESGYSVDRLRHMVADGLIANVGRKGAPRIRRADLPKKPGKGSTFDAGAAAKSILNPRRKK